MESLENHSIESTLQGYTQRLFYHKINKSLKELKKKKKNKQTDYNIKVNVENRAEVKQKNTKK